MAINTSYDACRKLVYDMNGLSTENQAANPFEHLPAEIAVGTPLFIGVPMLASKFNLSKPYSVWQQMKSCPGMTYSQAWDMVTSQNAIQKNATKYLKDKNSFWQTIKNKHQYGNLTSASSTITSNPTYYSEAKRLIEEAKAQKMTGKELKNQLAKIRTALAKGDARVNTAIANGTIKQTGRLGKLSHAIKGKTGYYKYKGKLLSSTKTIKGVTVGTRAASGMRLASKCAKGAGTMAIIQGVIETPDIIEAYKIDTKTGNKQLAKSATKVGTSVLGYAAGAAAAGAIAGSVVPGIGNVAGAIVGFIGGCIGGAIASWGAGKIWDKCNGEGSFDKTEVEIAMAQQADKKAEEIDQSSTNKAQLLAEANEELIDDEGNILGDEETLEAYNLLVAECENQTVTGNTQQNYNEPYTDEFIQKLLAWG